MSKKIKTVLAGILYNLAIEKGKKLGKRIYSFATPNSEELSTLETSTVEMSGKNPRIGLMLNGKQITKQAARMMLNNIGLAMGETIEGRAIAQTKASLEAVSKWEEKNGSLMVPAEDSKEDGKDESKPKKIDGFKKKHLKQEISKKEVKGSLSNSFEKKELKKILKVLFSDSKITTFAYLIPVIQDLITVDEIKAAFPNHF